MVNKLNTSLMWALTQQALDLIYELIASYKLDFDIAFTIVEQAWPEARFWEDPREIRDVG